MGLDNWKILDCAGGFRGFGLIEFWRLLKVFVEGFWVGGHFD